MIADGKFISELWAFEYELCCLYRNDDKCSVREGKLCASLLYRSELVMKMHGGCSRDMRMHELYMGQLVFEIHTSMYLLWKEDEIDYFVISYIHIYIYIYMFDIFYIFQNLRYQWNNYLRHYNSLTYIKQWIYKVIMLPYLIDRCILMW